MQTKLLIVAAMFILALPAAADFKTVELASEVALSDLRLPVSENGTIAYKECEKCDFLTKRVTAATRYQVDGRTVTLEKFREAVAQVSDRDMQAVTVLHHLEDDRITAVSVYL